MLMGNILGNTLGALGTCWGHSENLMGTSWERKNPKDSGSPHWLSRISMPTSVLYHFGRRLMAVGLSEPVSASSHHIKNPCSTSWA